MTKPTNGENYFAGEKGRNRVRLYPHPASGKLYIEWRDDADMKRRRALGHRDWKLGKIEADRLAGELATFEGRSEFDSMRLTLGTLFEKYEGEVTPRKSPRVQHHDRAARALLEESWGARFRVMDLGAIQWGRFIDARRAGRLGEAGAVGDRTVEHDLRFVLAVLNWGVQARLIPRNPALGLDVPRESNPRRELLTADEAQKIQKVSRAISPQFALAFTLALATGRRIGSIRHLRWSDVDLELGTVRFGKEFDKARRISVVALAEGAIDALRVAKRERQQHAAVIGDGWIFPSPRHAGSKPLDRNCFRVWWKAAEKRAGIEHIDGRAFHSCRRAFATEMLGRGAPEEIVNAIAGWSHGSKVARSIYQQPQLAQQRATMASIPLASTSPAAKEA